MGPRKVTGSGRPSPDTLSDEGELLGRKAREQHLGARDDIGVADEADGGLAAGNLRHFLGTVGGQRHSSSGAQNFSDDFLDAGPRVAIRVDAERGQPQLGAGEANGAGPRETHLERGSVLGARGRHRRSSQRPGIQWETSHSMRRHRGGALGQVRTGGSRREEDSPNARGRYSTKAGTSASGSTSGNGAMVSFLQQRAKHTEEG